MKTKLSHFPIFSFPHFLILAFSLFAFSSCSVEKRRYMDGYHVEWKKKTETGEGTERKQERKQELELELELEQDQDQAFVAEQVLEKAESQIIIDSTTAKTIEHVILVKPELHKSTSNKPIETRIKKIFQDPKDPRVVRIFKTNRKLIMIGLVVGSVLFTIGIILAFYTFFYSVMNSGNVSRQLEQAISLSLISGAGFTIVGLIAIIAQAILKGKYPGLNNVDKRRKSGDGYVDEPVSASSEPQPISKEVRKHHNKLYWSSTLTGLFFFIFGLYTFIILSRGYYFGLILSQTSIFLFSLGLIGICVFLLWAWIKLRKKKKAYLDEHPELMVIPAE